MEKRLIAFLVLSTVLIFAWTQLAMWLNPPPPRDQAALNKDGAPAEPAQPAPVEKTPATTEPKEEPHTPEKVEPAQPSDRPPQQWFSLGSIDPGSPYRLLATITNRGAAVERIELNHPDYRDLDETTGYLGHLALTPEPEVGVRVNVVGAGTPAAKAQPKTAGVAPGLKPGDVIVAADDQAIRTIQDLRDFLGEAKPGLEYRVERGKKPGAQIELTVRRQADGEARELTFTVTLGDRPMQIIQPEWGDPSDPATQSPPSFLLTLESVGSAAIGSKAKELGGLPSLYQETWEAREIDDGVEFRFRLSEEDLQKIGQPGPLEIVKRYRLLPAPGEGRVVKGYHLNFEVEIRNLSQQPQEVAFRLNGPNGLPLEGWWYLTKIHPGDIRSMFSAAGARDVIWRQEGWSSHSFLGSPAIAKAALEEDGERLNLFRPTAAQAPRDELAILANAGVDSQYFASALLPNPAPGEAEGTQYAFQRGWAVAVEEVDQENAAWRKTTNVSYQLASVPHKIAPGGQYRESYLIFAGPKQPDILAAYGHGLSDYIYFGWFGWVSQPMVFLLHFFESFLFNYGLAIVLLTILVRAAMYPLGRKAALNAKKMQELAPEMKAIAEKYKDDLQKRAEAQQELFRRHNYHPLSGCAPLFLQLPIFLGLYRGLAVDIELRGAPLIPGLQWCSNLAGPDMLWFWEPYLFGWIADPARGWLGPYFNLLPMVTIGLFLVHQKLFMPPATDEQARMQQQIMTFMTIFMGVLFFRVPAGLCVYFVVSSLWGIFERTVLLPKTPGPGEAAAGPPPKPSKPTGGPSKPGGGPPKPDARSAMRSLFGLGDGGAKKPTPRERRKQRQKKR